MVESATSSVAANKKLLLERENETEQHERGGLNLARFMRISSTIENETKSNREWCGKLLQYFEHPAAGQWPAVIDQSDTEIRESEVQWLNQILERAYVVKLGAPGVDECAELALLLGDGCIRFFADQASKHGHADRLLNVLDMVDRTTGFIGGTPWFVPYVFDLSKANQITTLQQWYDKQVLNNSVIDRLVFESFERKALQVLLVAMNDVIFAIDDRDGNRTVCDKAPMCLVQALHQNKVNMTDEVYLCFELVLRYGRDALFDPFCDELKSQKELNDYITGAFITEFSKHFQTVCEENQDTAATKQHQGGIATRSRSAQHMAENSAVLQEARVAPSQSGWLGSSCTAPAA